MHPHGDELAPSFFFTYSFYWFYLFSFLPTFPQVAIIETLINPTCPFLGEVSDPRGVIFRCFAILS